MHKTLRSSLVSTRVRMSVAAVAITATALLTVTTSCRAEPATPEGLWYTKNSESIIKVHPCNKLMCGTVVWLKEPTETDGSPKVDKLNTDPRKRDKPIIGLDVLLDLTPTKDHWKGKAYNADDGKFYDITFTVKTDKVANDQADIRGCILGFLCQTETFNRAAEVPGGDPTLVVSTPLGVAALPGLSAPKAAKAHGAKKETAHQ